jgi:hypothetical protein
MKVVSNTTPIISLASIGRLDILRMLFGEIIIPQAVYQEIKAKPSYAYWEIEASYIKVQSIQGQLLQNKLLISLDLGETETIILAQEIRADFVLIDENLAYKVAQQAGLNVVRTLSILLRAKQKGIVKQIKPLLDGLVANGRWYSLSVYESALKQAGE